MSQVQMSTSTDVTNSNALKLTAKSRRGSGLNVRNLAAFSQLAANEGLKLNIVAAGSRPNFQSERAVASFTSHASQVPPAKTTSQDTPRFTVPALNARLSGVMVGVMVAIAVGSQASSSPLPSEQAHSLQGMPIADAQIQAVSASSAQLQAVGPVENVATTSKEIDQPETIQSAGDGLLAETQAMIAEQHAIKEQIDMLDYVNTALSKELLQMELAMLTLESDARQHAGVRTVWNVVNVPIGGGQAASGNGSQVAQVSEVDDQDYYDEFEVDAFAVDAFASDL